MIDGQQTQPMLLVSPAGDFVVGLYTMKKQPDGEWKILGCSLIPKTPTIMTGRRVSGSKRSIAPSHGSVIEAREQSPCSVS
jgi:hypothetical protein